MLRLADDTTGTLIGPDVILDIRAEGVGGTVLVLHGLEGVPANDRFLSQLARTHRVLAPSHPGFDLSPRPDRIESVEDLAYLYLDYLEQIDARDVTVVGLQFGGWIAAEMAVRSTARLGRLVLADAVGVRFSAPTHRDIADVFALSREAVDELIYHDPANGPGSLTALPSDEVMRIARNEEALVQFGWEPYLHNPRLRNWLHRVDVPTLVAWGESDGIVSADYGRRLTDLLPRARFELIENAGHRPQVEQPEALAKLIADFVNQPS